MDEAMLAVLTEIRDELRLLRMGLGLQLRDDGPLGMFAGRDDLQRSMGAALSDGAQTLAQARRIADQQTAVWREIAETVHSS